MQKDHSVEENTQMNIQLINFNILLGLSLTSICPTNDIEKINNNTAEYNNIQFVGGRDEYLLGSNLLFIKQKTSQCLKDDHI